MYSIIISYLVFIYLWKQSTIQDEVFKGYSMCIVSVVLSKIIGIDLCQTQIRTLIAFFNPFQRRLDESQ